MIRKQQHEVGPLVQTRPSKSADESNASTAELFGKGKFDKGKSRQ